MTTLSQKAAINGAFCNERTSFNGLLGLIVHIYSAIENCKWLFVHHIYKNCVLLRKVEIFFEIMKNQCFASPDPKNGHIIAYEVSKCAYNLAKYREKRKLRSDVNCAFGSHFSVIFLAENVQFRGRST